MRSRTVWSCGWRKSAPDSGYSSSPDRGRLSRGAKKAWRIRGSAKLPDEGDCGRHVLRIGNARRRARARAGQHLLPHL
jgi:hypothetical protein